MGGQQKAIKWPLLPGLKGCSVGFTFLWQMLPYLHPSLGTIHHVFQGVKQKFMLISTCCIAICLLSVVQACSVLCADGSSSIPHSKVRKIVLQGTMHQCTSEMRDSFSSCSVFTFYFLMTIFNIYIYCFNCFVGCRKYLAKEIYW